MSKKNTPEPFDISTLIARHLMQCKVTISQWNGKIRDAKIARTVEEKASMESETIDVVRKLMKDEVEPLVKDAGKIRNYVYHITWNSDALLGITDGKAQNSWRCIPMITLIEESKIIDQKISALKDRWNVFLNKYESLIEQDLRAQGENANALDYPSLDEMKDKFKIKFHTQPMPVATKFADGILDSDLQKIQDEALENDRALVEGIVRQSWADIRKPLVSLVQSLDGTKSFYKEATMKSIVSTITLMRGFNITGDKDIEKALQDMEDKLTGFTAKELKKDPKEEKRMLDDAQDILDKYKSFF